MAKKETLSLEDAVTKIKRKIEAADKVKAEGGSIFSQIKARLTNPDTGRPEGDYAVHAIKSIIDSNQVKEFIDGYITDIKDNPEEYPTIAKKRPIEFAVTNIYAVLGMHFPDQEYHERWNSALNQYETR